MLFNSMKNFYWKYLASNRLTAILFIIFPTSMALGTFIESWYSTDTAKIWIYNAWWFELIMFLFVINFVGNIFKYKLFRRDKLAILGLHLSFILILVGAFVTRYIGYEGVMPIREGDSTSKFLSDKTYLTVLVDGEIEGKVFRKKIKKELLLSEHVQNDFDIEQNFKDIKFNITYMDFMENVTEDLVLDPDGYKYIKIVEAIDGTRHNHYIKEGEVSNIHNVLFTLNNPIKGAINIEVIDGEYFLTSPFKGSFLRMADQYTDNIVPEKKENLQFRSLYTISNYQFVIPEPVLRGKFDVVKLDQQEDNFQDMLKVRVGVGGESKEVNLLGGKGFSETNKKVSVGPLDFYMSYGSVEMNLPFEIKLNDLTKKFPKLNAYILGVIRNEKFIFLKKKDILKKQDKAYVIINSSQMQLTLDAFGHSEKISNKFLIIGGGNIGFNLAKNLEDTIDSARIKIIEKNKERAEYIANNLNNTLVINGNGLDEDILKEANIEDAETVLALTNDDEDNLMVSVLVEKFSKDKRTMALINKPNYSLLQNSLKIDDLIDPRMNTVSSILKHVHKGTIETAYTILNGDFEVIEAEIIDSSELINKELKNSNLPDDIRIGAILRKDDIIIPTSKFIFEKKDIVVFLAKRDQLPLVERLFQISSI